MGRNLGIILFFLALASELRIATAKVSPPTTYIFMNVAWTDSSTDTIQVCANFYPYSRGSRGFSPPARRLQDATPYRLADDDGFCRDIISNPSFLGDIVFTKLHDDRHSYRDCDDQRPKNINELILKLEARNASAVLFDTTPDETHASYYDPQINSSAVSLPIYYINRQTRAIFEKFVNKSTKSTYLLRFFIPSDPIVDAAIVIIIVIAITCIAVGGAWSGRTHYELFLQEVSRQAALKSESTTQSTGPRADAANVHPGNVDRGSTETSATSEPATAPFNWLTLIIFLSTIIIFLMLLYIFYHVLIWAVIVIYVIASSSAMCECLWYFVQKIPYGKHSFRLDPIADLLTKICRCCKWKILRFSVEYRHAALYIFSVSFAIVWCIYRHWSYAFVLHDILAIFFSIVTIRNLRMPNLMWLTCLLSLMLVYDLFMVFITPYMTPSGCSIMVDVATGGACSRSSNVPDATRNLPPSSGPPNEDLPIMLRVPYLNNPLWSCYRMEVDLQYPATLLGLGDIILPGILIGYNSAFSLAWKTHYQLYYVISIVGYFFGMIATFAALLLSKLGQPALIYLVPFTLIPTHVTAWVRKEWKNMWSGQFPIIEESCPILKPDDVERQPARQVANSPRKGSREPSPSNQKTA